MSEAMLEKVREIQGLASAIVEAMQSAERPSSEDLGIAFVCGEAIVDLTHTWELDLLTELTRPKAANQRTTA